MQRCKLLYLIYFQTEFIMASVTSLLPSNETNYSFIELLNSHSDDDTVNDLKHSTYIDETSLMHILDTKLNPLTMLSLNIQSISAKFDQLFILINRFNANNTPLSII